MTPMDSERDVMGTMRDAEGEFALPVADVLRTILRRLWVILTVAILCAGLAVGYSLVADPLYEASTKVLVGQGQGIVEDPSQAYNLQQITLTLSEVVATRSVVEPVVRELGLKESPEDVIGRLGVEVRPETQVIDLSYRGNDPQEAQRIVNSVGNRFSSRLADVSPVNGVTATVWESASLPEEPVRPKPVLYGLVGALLGGILGLGLAFLLENLDDSWRSPEEVELVSGVPTFGVIPVYEFSKGKGT